MTETPARARMRLGWRILVGVKDFMAFIALLLFFFALYLFLSGGPDPAENRKGALLLDLSGALVEQTEASDPRSLLGGGLPVGGQIRVRDVVRALDLAAKDDGIKAVVLDLGGFWGGGQAAIDDVSDALARVRAAKKPVYAHAIGYSDDGWRLAVHANEIWMDPMGAAMFTGPGGTRPYYKDLLDRYGVTIHDYRVGKFKSFVEPYTRAEQSPEAKQAGQALIDAIWQGWLDDVKRLRPKATLDPFIADPAARAAENGGDMAKAALANGIIDQIGDRTKFGQRVAKLVGSDDDKGPGDFNASSMDAYLSANPPSESGDAIGVVTVAGSIVDGHAPTGTAGGATISELVDEAVSSGNVKALVVRVDSGGGSAFASEEIRLAFERAKAKGIPVVASMGSAAASGGYWVAMAGDKVFAQPSTITGSIGVFAIIPTLEKTAPRFGITGDGVRATPLAGQPDVLLGTNEATDRMLQAGVEDIYRRFLTLVSTKRKMSVERVNEIAQGRVWDGGTARQLGLVDAFGTVDDAIAEAARMAKLDPKNVHRLDIEPGESFVSGLLSMIGIKSEPIATRDIFTRAVMRQRAMAMASLSDIQSMASGTVIQARCLECPSTRLHFSGKGPFEQFLDKVFYD